MSGWVRVSGEGANKLAPQGRDSRGVRGHDSPGNLEIFRFLRVSFMAFDKGSCKENQTVEIERKNVNIC